MRNFSDFVDISFAAATPKGLVVPVIRNVESMSLLEVSFNPQRLKIGRFSKVTFFLSGNFVQFFSRER